MLLLSSAAQVKEITRDFQLIGGDLSYVVQMATNSTSLQPHLRALLKKQWLSRVRKRQSTYKHQKSNPIWQPLLFFDAVTPFLNFHWWINNVFPDQSLC